MLLLIPCKQKLVDFVLHNQRLYFSLVNVILMNFGAEEALNCDVINQRLSIVLQYYMD